MPDNSIGENAIEIMKDFERLLFALKELKPNDRSEQDRYWAITITEVEKAKAVFQTYAVTRTLDA